MSWDAGAAVAFLTGLVTLRLATTSQMQFYVKTGMRPLLLVAAVVLLLMGLGSVVLRGRSPKEEGAEPAGGAHEQADGHGHGSGPGARIGWMVLAPLAALILVAPAPLGAFAADRADSRPPPRPPSPEAGDPAAGFVPLPAPRDGAVDLSLSEFMVWALYDESRQLEDAPVRLTGFVTHREKGSFALVRFTLSCCAADARPVKVIVRTDQPIPADETWLEVVGTWVPQPVYEPAGDEPVPDVAVELESAREIAAPDQPYEY